MSDNAPTESAPSGRPRSDDPASNLRTRQPTGRVSSPFILVEGEEKAGKSAALAQLAASPRVGRCFYLELGDGVLDEYASLGDGRYELLLHDGTWGSILEQIEAAAAVPMDPEKPNVIGVDSGTHVWSLLKAWAERRARSSERARNILRRDPDAEIEVTMPYWNDAKERWGRLMTALRGFQGIAVITATGREVTRVENGQPTRETEWSVEVEKSTPGVVSAWVRIKRPQASSLIGVRSLGVAIPRGGLDLPSENMLDHLVFEVIGAGGGEFAPSTAVAPEVGVDVNKAKGRVVGAVKAAGENLSDDDAKAEAKRLWDIWGMGVGPEVHQSALTALLLAIAEGVADHGPGGPPEPEPDEAVEDPQDDGADEEPQDPPEDGDGPEEAPEAPETAKESGPGGRDLASLTRTEIDAMKKPEVVTWLRSLSLKTSGNLGDLQERLWEAVKPFDAAEAPPEDPRWADVPSDAIRDRCVCGEPIWRPKGAPYQENRHLDPELDGDHQADTPF